jgi:hypothetical protein
MKEGLTKQNHDELLDDLESRLNERYYGVHREIAYPHGEIDMYVIVDDRALLFEAKRTCNAKTMKKAELQLERNTQYLLDHTSTLAVYRFFVSEYGIEYWGKINRSINISF